MTKSLLSNCRLLDLSDRTGHACALFFASLGAEVIRVDAPGAPFDPLLHRGKKSVSLNLDTEDGIDLFKQLIQQCDFLLDTFQPGYLPNKGLAYDKLETLNPRLIHIAITPFGQCGPYAHYIGGELVASAMGGTLTTCGYPNDTPVLEALDACCFQACAAAALGALLAHRERGLSGRGQFVDCSIQETAASRNTNNLLSYQFDRRKLPRAGDKVQFGSATVRVVWELADGFCFHSLMTGKFGAPANAALSQWMTDEGFDTPMADVDWEHYDRGALPPETRWEWETAMDTFFKSKTKDDIRTEGRARGIRATVANEPGDVVKDEHLAARKFLQAVHLPDGDTVVAPDYFVRLQNSEFRLPKHLATPGEHNREIYGARLGLDDATLARYRNAGVI